VIEGYRRAIDLWEDKPSFKELGDNDKLAVAKLDLERALAPDQKERIQQLGKPSEIIELTYLKAYTMLSMIKILKGKPPQFAPMSGTFIGDGKTENCASIIYKVLLAGGANKIFPPLNEQLTRVDLDYVVPLIMLIGTGYGLMPALEYSLYSLAAARFAGGALEGLRAIDSLMDLMKREKQTLPAFLDLRTLYTAYSGLLSVVMPGSTPMRINVLPQDVWNLAQQLERVEKAQATAGPVSIAQRLNMI
jgi:hypothetical protein